MARRGSTAVIRHGSSLKEGHFDTHEPAAGGYLELPVSGNRSVQGAASMSDDFLGGGSGPGCVQHYTAQDLDLMADEQRGSVVFNPRSGGAARRGSTLSMLSARHSSSVDSHAAAERELTRQKLAKEAREEVLQEEIDALLAQQDRANLHIDEDGVAQVSGAPGAVVQLTNAERLAIDREKLYQNSPSVLSEPTTTGSRAKIAKIVTAE
jgi:hypothetical protein